MDALTYRVLDINACSMFKNETQHLQKTPLDAAILVCNCIGIIPSLFAGTLEDAETLHNEAMVCCDKALFSKVYTKNNIKAWYRRALAFERAAAQLCPIDLEPSRSILFSSAAFCAIDAGEYEEARQLVASGFAGTPAAHTAMRLNEALELINKNA